jgi:hypothetical protein
MDITFDSNLFVWQIFAGFLTLSILVLFGYLTVKLIKFINRKV